MAYITVETKEGCNFLRQVSKEVTDINDSQVQECIKTLIDFCKDKNNYVYAMAAVQLGYPFRIIAVNEKFSQEELEHKPRILINPSIITNSSWGDSSYYERCASGLKISANVHSPVGFTLTYQDVNGQTHIE